MKRRNKTTKVTGRVQLMLVMLAAILGVTAGGWRVDAMTATTSNSTLAGNSADTDGGGIFYFALSNPLTSSTLTLTNTTLSDNSAGDRVTSPRLTWG